MARDEVVKQENLLKQSFLRSLDNIEKISLVEFTDRLVQGLSTILVYTGKIA